MDKKPLGAERRQFARIKRHYIIRFYQKDNASMKYEVSQVENISKGGMCFTSTIPFEKESQLSVELRTPYVSETVYLEGTVLESKEKIPGVLYQNRFRFEGVTPQAGDALDKIEKYNLKG